MDQIDEFYRESFLSLQYKDFSFKMGYTALTNLLRELGMKTNSVRKFEQNLIDKNSKNIAIDGHMVYYEEQTGEKTRVIFFKDVDENNSKRKNYKRLMELGESGYTQENYEKYCQWWGVYALQTTMTGPASTVYSDYKARWGIETYNNYVKNDADFNDLKLQDYYNAHGFDFIMLVTGLIHSRLNEAVKALNKPNLSTFDILVKAGHMRMVLDKDEWHLRNTRTKDLQLLEAMGFVPAKSYPA